MQPEKKQMDINKDKLIDLIASRFNGNNSLAARNFGVTPQHMIKFLKTPKAKAGAELLGGLAVFCFHERLNFWEYIILPERLT